MSRKRIVLRAGKKVGRSTSASAEKRSITVILVPVVGGRAAPRPSGASSWRDQTFWRTEDRYYQLLGTLQPLLSLYSVVDTVFAQDDAFDDAARRYGFGRIYEEWKRVRSALDPEYDPSEDERGGTGVRGTNKSVLQPRIRRTKRGGPFGA